MLNKPLVSVIIPAYNCAKYLPSAIESVFKQTYQPIEVIVINDGSPDNTDEVVEPYLKQIKYIKQENRGLSSARNAGFNTSNGEFICFLDADDLLSPEKFEKQLSVFEREPDLGVIICGYQNISEDGKTILRNVPKYWHRDALERLLNHEVFPPHAPLIRRDVLVSSPLFPEDIVTAESQEDWQLWLELALSEVAFSSVPEPLCQYRYRPGSISSFPLRHLDGARRVVSLLRQHPKAMQYQLQIERLAGIVEMERVARALQAGMPDLAFTAMAKAYDQAQSLWREPSTWLRFFLTCLPFESVIQWQQTLDLNIFKKTIIDHFLVNLPAKFPLKTHETLLCAAWLMLSDLAYGQGNNELRKIACLNAWKSDRKTCLSSQGVPSFIRALLGPKLVSTIKFPRNIWRTRK